MKFTIIEEYQHQISRSRTSRISGDMKEYAMKQVIRLTAILLAALMSVTACSDPASISNALTDTVNVSFRFPEPKTTSVSSGSVDSVLIEDVYFQYKAENISGIKIGEAVEWTNLTADDVSGLGDTIRLGRGVWNISLRGFASADARTAASIEDTENTTAIFAGNLPEFNVGTGSATLYMTADVPLEFTNNVGKGSCSVTVTFTEEYAAFENKSVLVNLQCGTFDETKILTFGTNGAEASDVAEFTDVDNGIATITIDYLDENGNPFGDGGTANTLIMTDMHTSTTATISMNIVEFCLNGKAPTQTPEDRFANKVIENMHDIYPDNVPANAMVIGYSRETKALAPEPITYPFKMLTLAEKDENGRYKASELGITPIYVTNREELNESGATEAWFGKGVVYTAETEPAVNTTLESVKFLEGTTEIGRYALANCTGLTNVEIPESVVSIGERAFSNCYNLSEIAIPDSVTTIDDEAFNWCTSLSDITLGNSISTIGYRAFYNCDGLTEISLPDSVTTIGEGAFRSCDNLSSIVIPDSVTRIEDNTFAWCDSLTNVTIGSSVETIGRSAFAWCDDLNSVNLPDSLTTIEDFAFYYCNKLERVSVPASVTVGDKAFQTFQPQAPINKL